MTEAQVSDRGIPVAPVLLFIFVEAACLLAFVFLRQGGYADLAWLVLVAPCLLLVVAVALRSEYWLLCSTAGLLPFTALELLPYRFVHAVLLGMLGAWLVLSLSARAWNAGSGTGRVRPRWLPLLPAFALVVLASNVGVALRGSFGTPLFQDTIVMVEVLILVGLSASAPRTLSQVAGVVSLVGAGYTIVCLALPLFGAMPGGGLAGKTIVTYGGVVNMNAFAAQVGAVLLALSGMFAGRSRRPPLVLLLSMGILLAALVFTRSRGAWLGFGVAFLYLIFRLRSLRMTILAGVSGLALASSEFLAGMVTSRVRATGVEDPSLLWRLYLWRTSLEVFKDNWLIGAGFQNFRFVKYRYGFSWPKQITLPFNSHSLYLEMLADLGVLGFALALIMFASAMVALDRVASRRGVAGRGIAVGVCAALVMYLVHGFFDCIIWHHGAFLLLGLLLGLSGSIVVLSSGPIEGSLGDPRLGLGPQTAGDLEYR